MAFGKTFLSLQFPSIMGILNVTPDSFSDGGKFKSIDSALFQAEKMISDGATILDVGGESTRPGSDVVPEAEELRRTQPVISAIRKRFPQIGISIDTTKLTVAKAALDAGAEIVNDVSGLQKEPELARLAASFGAGLVIMHSKGEPKTMQQNPHYDDVVDEIAQFLAQKVAFATSCGVSNIILDPGIGFGKRLEHNISIIKHLETFTSLGFPILIGASRKSMIGQITGRNSPTDRLAGTLAVHYQSLLAGANILRVHDVQETADIISVYRQFFQ